MKTTCLHFNQTHLLKPLVKDYIHQEKAAQALTSFAPTPEGIAQSLEARRKVPIDRPTLVQSLKAQYKAAGIADKAIGKQIDTLAKSNTFTITTGHQLNLFGSTQYFIYKMVEVIKYTQALKKRFPDDHFVPVFWLASEDHDFDEINHARIEGKRYEWQTAEKGAVGPFNPAAVLQIIEELEDFWVSETVTGNYLKDLFSKAYAAPNLADATRIWVHELFKQYGLVVVDGNDAALKTLFAPVMKNELLEQRTFKAIEATNTYLQEQNYHIQVYARNINLFYLHENGRDRLTRTSSGFATVDSELEFTEEELLAELWAHPERFSPNALMRPMYQETILPNLAYVGGAGEIAYWLQEKTAFEAHGVFYPQVVARNSAIWLNRRLGKKLEKIGLAYTDFFQRKEDLIAQYAESHHSGRKFFELSKTIEKLWAEFQEASETTFHDLKLKAGVTAADKQKELKKLRHDLRKIVKAKNDADLVVVHEVYDSMFPNGSFQERIDTFLPTYLRLGKSYLEMLFEHIEPCGHKVLILEY